MLDVGKWGPRGHLVCVPAVMSGEARFRVMPMKVPWTSNVIWVAAIGTGRGRRVQTRSRCDYVNDDRTGRSA